MLWSTLSLYQHTMEVTTKCFKTWSCATKERRQKSRRRKSALVKHSRPMRKTSLTLKLGRRLLMKLSMRICSIWLQIARENQTRCKTKWMLKMKVSLTKSLISREYRAKKLKMHVERSVKPNQEPDFSWIKPVRMQHLGKPCWIRQPLRATHRQCSALAPPLTKILSQRSLEEGN